MATNIWHAKWKQVEENDQDEDEDEELEALSLCDLPVNSIEQEDLPRKPPASQISETREAEFDFCSWGGPVEMCSADEVFFQGQMLPLCVSSKSTTSQRYGQKHEWLFESRSESMDHFSSSEFHSSSSRSSSLRSQNSCSSTSSTTITTRTTRTSNARREVRGHQFYTHHPSPKPQLKANITRQGSFGNNHGRKSSSAWDIFRLGVVPAPEIGLQDIKVRSTNNVNSKNYSNFNFNFNASVATTNNSVEMSNNISGKSKNVLKQFMNKGSGLFSGCKCSSIETVEADIAMIGGHTKKSNETEGTVHAMKEKVVEQKRQNSKVKQGKKGVPRHQQSFEWMKGLLNNTKYHDEEALLSSSS
ncbi:uncharacterized protein LOC107487682 [Arachis duranensis]|uniref:Uncharacterized protein LOC107487682 n=1 Tax=Arachis duranensis TaxID=130453 RepID=A0A6P4DF96_ARADU|nr:uncharacterized protein LOC107487682 [Arachis duranensis]